MFDAAVPDLPTALPRGQVIARGVALFDGNFDPLKPMAFCDRRWDGGLRGLADRLSVWSRRQYPHTQDRAVIAY
jgi:hypothetical protein